MKEDTGGDVTAVRISVSDDSSSDAYDDEVTTVHELSEDFGSERLDIPAFNGPNHPATVVHATNSSNIEIKPITQTQYFAPVTIHQYSVPVDSENNKESGDVAKDPTPNVALDSWNNILFHGIDSRLRCKLGIVLVIIAAIIISTVVAFQISEGKTNFAQPVADTRQYDLGNGRRIFPRDRWGGRELRPGWENRTLSHPIQYVIIAHTVSRQCMTFDNCASSLQSIQSEHISRWGYVDIGINFLIGGDGRIYEALGWDLRNYVRNNTIEISFMGNYDIDEVLDDQREAVQILLDFGVTLGKLDENYTLVGHYQVRHTASPGKNLKADIKLWPHYSPDYL